MHRHLTLLIVLLFSLPITPARAQPATQPQNNTTALGGVAISPEGLLSIPATRAPAAIFQPKPNNNFTYLSLKNLFSAVQTLTANGTPVPNDLRYLGGLTRIDYIYLYPGDHDIVLAGSSEPLDLKAGANPLQPVGTLSHRPTLHLDDLVITLRLAAAHRDAKPASRNFLYGCSLDMPPNAQQIATDIYSRFSNASNAALAVELKRALGPQTVRFLNIPPDSRLALAMITADYRLKRIAMAAESPPVAGIGNALASGGIASNRVWFEPSYSSLDISEDQLSYQLLGPRLKVLAGPVLFESKSADSNGGREGRGATTSATAFAKRFSDNLPAAAARLEALADLQNVTDLFLIATLLEHPTKDLAHKANLDLAWILATTQLTDSPPPYVPTSYTAPTSAETLLAKTSTSLTSGGIAFTVSSFLGIPSSAPKQELTASRARPAASWFLTQPQSK